MNRNMHPARSISRAMHGCGHLPLLRRPHPCGSTSAAASLTCSSSSPCALSALHQPTRHLSQQASQWLGKLRYGTEEAPSLGSWENAYEDNAMVTRRLYCKALVYASGGSRLARDWIAGCAALTSPDPSLIYTALQHTAAEADVEELREHLLERLLAQERDGRQLQPQQRGEVSEEVVGDGAARRGHVQSDEHGKDSTATFSIAEAVEAEPPVLRGGDGAKAGDVQPPAAGAPSSVNKTVTAAFKKDGVKGDVGDDDSDEGDDTAMSLSPESIREAEHYLLSRLPEVRCFMYDAMSASLFHSNYDLHMVELARRHTFWIGANIFGISFDELTLLWRVVEAEQLVKKEKIKVLGQPFCE
ncbi:hypothetical protein ABL78_6894 [Leptomonas seymouri]|uniref:Uncharacterized protein n=1 Tax=Leptomonas seymouri TaxID=5684 RepID=A0A0N0P3F1_LEPSE|nr:hypothetical protein ABL78_6894 [Leptomonas seymouri]|eukprot:KPI84049.1 hypothetical protein ABL78_6894 [Leptomonas seymouri]